MKYLIKFKTIIKGAGNATVEAANEQEARVKFYDGETIDEYEDIDIETDEQEIESVKLISKW